MANSIFQGYGPARFVTAQVVIAICCIFCTIQLIVFLVSMSRLKEMNRHMRISSQLVFVASTLAVWLSFFKQTFLIIVPSDDIGNIEVYCQIVMRSWILTQTYFVHTVLYYFSVRVEKLFKNSAYAYPIIRLKIYRLILTIVTILGIILLFILIKTTPGNSHTGEIGLTSNVNMCTSTVDSRTQNTHFAEYLVSYLCVILALVIINSWILLIFLQRLWMVIRERDKTNRTALKLTIPLDVTTTPDEEETEPDIEIKHTRTDTYTNPSQSKHISSASTFANIRILRFGQRAGKLVNVMKRQTFLVSIAVLSTLILWIINIWIGSTIPFIVDSTITSFCVFLSFKMNDMFYLGLKCDKCSEFCCQPMDHFITKKLIVSAFNHDESQMIV